MSHQLIFETFLSLMSGYALVRGGGPERAGAALMLFSVTLSAIVAPSAIPVTLPFSRFEAALFWVDLLGYVASLLLMLCADRYWPIWMSALFGVELLAHLLALVGWPSLNLTYAILEKMWGYPLASLPAIGTWRHRRRVETFGADGSWSHPAGLP